MPHVCGEQRQLGLDIETVAVPLKQRPHSKAMPEVVQPWAAPRRARCETGGSDQPGKHVMYAGLAQTSGAERDQERVAARLHETLVAQPCIVGEGVHRAVVQHDLSALAELAVEDPQQLVAVIDVGAIETDRLARRSPVTDNRPISVW